jgi:hypothetical protein
VQVGKLTGKSILAHTAITFLKLSATSVTTAETEEDLHPKLLKAAMSIWAWTVSGGDSREHTAEASDTWLLNKPDTYNGS